MQRIYRGYPQMVHTMEVMEQMHREYEPSSVIGPADQMFQVPMNDGVQEAQERSQGFDPRYGQGYGWEGGPGFDPRYGQGYGWGNSQGFDPRYGQGYGWEGGPGFNPGLGENFNPGFGQDYGRERVRGYSQESAQGLSQEDVQENIQDSIQPNAQGSNEKSSQDNIRESVQDYSLEEGQDLVQEAQAETRTQNQAQPALQPYMVYRRGEQEIPAIDRTQALRMEMDYFKSLYPQSVKKHQVLVDEICDRLDYDGSPMYDEYPDRVSLFRTRDRVCRNVREAGIEDNRDLAQLLLVNEMNRRRFLRKG